MAERGRRALGAGLLGLGAVAAWEAASVARLLRHEDRDDRADHATTVGTGLGEPLHLLLLGDSAVDGYGLSAAESLPRQLAVRLASATGRRIRVRSVAVSGATTRDVLEQQVPLLRAALPVDAVLIGVGVNDALRRTGRAELEAATQELAGAVRALVGTAPIAYIPCYDLSVAPGLRPVLRRALGLRCRAVRRRQLDVLAQLDVEPVTFDGRGTPQMYGPDGLHPGTEAVEVVASLAVRCLVAPAEPAAEVSTRP